MTRPPEQSCGNCNAFVLTTFPRGMCTRHSRLHQKHDDRTQATNWCQWWAQKQVIKEQVPAHMAYFPQTREAKRLHIRAACDNAMENSYDVSKWDLDALVFDLQCYDLVAENMDEKELREVVKEWQDEHK